jgi:hypothetical protein
MSTPEAINMLAWVCLRLWNDTRGNPFEAHTRRQSLDKLSGESGLPSIVEKTNVSASILPSPS